MYGVSAPIVGALAAVLVTLVWLALFFAPWQALVILGGLGAVAGAVVGHLLSGSWLSILAGLLVGSMFVAFIIFVTQDCAKGWHAERYGHLYPEGVFRPGELWDYSAPVTGDAPPKKQQPEHGSRNSTA